MTKKGYCYHYDYLPYKPSDLKSECGYCKENIKQRQSIRPNIAKRWLEQYQKDTELAE